MNDDLIFAVQNNNVELVKTLIDANYNIHIQDSIGNDTALHWASFKGHKEIVELLLNAGADVNKLNKHGHTALLDASWNGKTSIVKLLLKANANADIQNTNGYTALTVAIENNHYDIIKILLEYGVSVKNINKYDINPLKKHKDIYNLLKLLMKLNE
jgi:ankyrin repeat protein